MKTNNIQPLVNQSAVTYDRMSECQLKKIIAIIDSAQETNAFNRVYTCNPCYRYERCQMLCAQDGIESNCIDFCRRQEGACGADERQANAFQRGAELAGGGGRR